MTTRLSRGHVRLIAVLAAICVALSVAVIAAAVTAGRQRVDIGGGAPVTLPPVTALATRTPDLLDVARAGIGQVVTVEAVRANEESLGTGWLLDGHGDFVTNAHVIAGQLGIRLRDREGHTHFTTVLGVNTTEDVALLRSADGFAGAGGLTIEPQAALSPPLAVVVIASSKATGQADITIESLSRAGADVPVEGNPDLQPGTPTTTLYRDMLELQGARIFQGNSGGPVLNARGRVVGIVTLASKSGTNAYAIPIWRVLDELRGWASR